MTSITTNFATTSTATSTARNTPTFLRLLNWVANMDASYRENQRIASLTADELADMGLNRDENNQLSKSHTAWSA